MTQKALVIGRTGPTGPFVVEGLGDDTYGLVVAQCGRLRIIASMMEGSEISPAEQRAKLELVTDVARSVWS